MSARDQLEGYVKAIGDILSIASFKQELEYRNILFKRGVHQPVQLAEGPAERKPNGTISIRHNNPEVHNLNSRDPHVINLNSRDPCFTQISEWMKDNWDGNRVRCIVVRNDEREWKGIRAEKVKNGA